ncbi:hypothetical protein UT300012_33000 [Paraclostridium bifermentans]
MENINKEIRGMNKLDPIKVLEQLIEDKAKSMITFGEVYISLYRSA